MEFVQKEGYATPPVAERETRRGVLRPGHYAYTMGKHEILALREKLRARQGGAFDLLAFDDGFMRLPYSISVIERMLLEPETSAPA